MQVTSLSPSEAEVLLHHFKWNKDELLNCYLAGQQRETLLRKAGLSPNVDRPHSAASVQHVECPVCLEPITNTATLSLTCEHKCCIVSEAVMFSITCMMSPPYWLCVGSLSMYP